MKKLLIVTNAIIGLSIILVISCKSLNKKEEKDFELWKDRNNREFSVKATFYEKYIKRILDIGISFCGIIIFTPIIVASSATVYIEDPGNVIFKQKRVGINKTYFYIHKLRSMKLNTPDIPTHLMKNPEKYILKTGKIYRKLSIDELYQLFDILRGRMSVVGPRPALWNQNDLISERDKYGANSIRPGLTGWAQINGRDELEIPVKAKLDGDYCCELKKNSWSGFKMDCRCFFGTLKSVINSDGVVEGGTSSINKTKSKREYCEGKTDAELIGNIGFGEPVQIDKDSLKKVLITGSGSYVGCSFINYARKNYLNNFEIDELDMVGDTWEKKDFSKYDIVYHVAGIAHADVSNVPEKIKEKYYAINTDLAIDTAKKAKADGVKRFIFMSSMIVYGDSVPYNKKKLIDESTVPVPTNFYGNSKFQADVAVRELADDNFKVIVLRAPMIYGRGSKGNYSTLVKIARKFPVFLNIDNARSMIYIDNLCEFLCQIMLIKEIKQNATVLIPQNAEWSKTSEMIKEIAKINGKNVFELKTIKPVIAICGKIPWKIGKIINKAFGNNCYIQKISVYEGISYQNVSLKESLKKTELKKGEKINSVCIINCFDTYEQRVALLYDYFKKNYDTVKVITSDFKHIEKCKRTNPKKDYEFISTIPYQKNLSIERMISHISLSKSIYDKIEHDKYDLLWILVPPNSIVKDAAKYKKKHKDTKFVFDLIDLWPETIPLPKLKSLPPFIYWRNLRNKYLEIADIIITECNLYHEKLPQNLKNKLRTIYLAREIKDFTSNLNLPNNKMALCYLGSINNIIDILAIANLIRNIEKYIPVELHIIGDGENREELISSCKAAGATVIYHGKIYDKLDKQKIFDSCHYGLNIMKKSVFVGLTMKSIDYFEAGLPILNNIQGDTWDYITDYYIGYNIDFTIDYKKIISYRIEMRKQTRNFYEEVFGIDKFNKNVKKVIEEIL